MAIVCKFKFEEVSDLTYRDLIILSLMEDSVNPYESGRVTGIVFLTLQT